MKCIYSDNTDPYFNLAAEEHLLRSLSGEYYFQYTNTPSVVIGKHQNALAEVDIEYMQRHGIALARRISGGGAVYHDRGNMNYSFITDEEPGDLIKFKKYTAPVIEALKKLDVIAFPGKRNEVLVGERKISGTASHVFKNRVLHHGTLLFDADLEVLGKCLYKDVSDYQDRAVRSIRSEVVNINGLLESSMGRDEFYLHVFRSVLTGNKGNEEWNFSDEDLRNIERLREEKFKTWDWNFGYSPKFEISRVVEVEGVPVAIKVLVNKGIIEDVVFGGGDKIMETKVLSEKLKGARHEMGEVGKILENAMANGEVRNIILEGIF